MKILDPQVIVYPFEAEKMLAISERAIRVCYKSEEKIGPGSAAGMVGKMVRSGHLSTLEHVSVTVKFICDRGVTHELVRHRIAAYSQESTRYCNYGKDKFGREISVIRPYFFAEDSDVFRGWQKTCEAAEAGYMQLLDDGATPQEARSVLPNSLKTEIVTTANLREWRHIFALRATARAHPQIRQVMIPLMQFFVARGLAPYLEDVDYDKNFPPEHYAEVLFADGE